jgi:hypothetical protein
MAKTATHAKNLPCLLGRQGVAAEQTSGIRERTDQGKVTTRDYVEQYNKVIVIVTTDEETVTRDTRVKASVNRDIF